MSYAAVGSVVVDSLLFIAPIFLCGFYVWSLFCYLVPSVISSFAIIGGKGWVGCSK